MIRRLRLRHWRSYDTLDLAFEPGTTFVVAPNGVGKTSLVLGLAWALYGEHADVDPRACIRAGAESAEVEITLTLGDDVDLTIARKIGRKGKPTVNARLDGAEIDEPALVGVLEQAFEIKLDVAATLSMMLGGGQLASKQPLDLKSHLYTAFGVAQVLAAAESAEALAKQAERQRAAVRATDQSRLANRAEIESGISVLQDELQELNVQREAMQAAVRQADQARARAAQVQTYYGQLRGYEAAVEGIVLQARELVAGEVNTGDFTQVLRTEGERAERAADIAGERHVTARASIAAATEAIGILTRIDAYCPTCLRPIDASEAAAATSQHEHRLHEATEVGGLSAQEQAEQRSRGMVLFDLLAEFDSLQSPTPPDSTADLDAVESDYVTALQALEAQNQAIGGRRSQLEQLAGQLAEDDRVAETERALYRAYRREAITSAASIAFRQAATELTESLIEPLAKEITWRWKRLFATGGLILRSDGTIVREEHGEELGWSTLSDGERIWARIVTHLLVVSSSTRLPFVWFDEPLEHLDPQLRHAVAATLATVTTDKDGALRQLLVTTYEHAIARQLADDSPNAALINVRAR